MKVQVRLYVSLVICYKVHICHVCIYINAVFNHWFPILKDHILNVLILKRTKLLLFIFHLLSVPLLPWCLRRLITTSCVLLCNFVTVEGWDFEIDSSKLNDVSHAHHLTLVVWEEILEYLVNWAFLSNNQPHRLLKINIILFVFVCLTLSLSLLVDRLNCTVTVLIGTLIEIRWLEEGLIVGP